MVWQQAKDLAVIVYRLSDVGALSKDYSLRDQIRRSVISIASNLAEGDERDTDKESVHFFYIAKGSLAELRTQTEIAHEISYLEKQSYENIEEKCALLGKMIGGLIKVRKTGRANRGS